MTTNPLERAVLEAARKVVASGPVDPDGAPFPEYLALVRAVEALEDSREPEVTEIGWHEIAEGDQLRSARNGRFYPVLTVLRLQGGMYRITIQAGTKPVSVERPTPAEPSAFVKRGQAGQAVTNFVHVFTSGEL